MSDRPILASAWCQGCHGEIVLYARDGEWAHRRDDLVRSVPPGRDEICTAEPSTRSKPIPARMDGELEALPFYYTPGEIARGDNSHEVTLWFGSNDEAEAFRRDYAERPVISLVGFVPIRCEAVVHHGPGGQSWSRCQRQDPHPIEGDHYHYDSVVEAEWTGPRGFASYYG